jgi:hypothetical protein
LARRDNRGDRLLSEALLWISGKVGEPISRSIHNEGVLESRIGIFHSVEDLPELGIYSRFDFPGDIPWSR